MAALEELVIGGDFTRSTALENCQFLTDSLAQRIGHYMSCDFDDLFEASEQGPEGRDFIRDFYGDREEELAYDVASLLRFGLLSVRAESGSYLPDEPNAALEARRIREEGHLVLEANSISAVPEQSFEFDGEEVPVFEKARSDKESEKFAEALNSCLEYLIHVKGENIKHVDYSWFPVDGSLVLPEGIISYRAGWTPGTGNDIAKGMPQSLEFLDLYNTGVDGGLDLSELSNLRTVILGGDDLPDSRSYRGLRLNEGLRNVSFAGTCRIGDVDLPRTVLGVTFNLNQLTGRVTGPKEIADRMNSFANLFDAKRSSLDSGSVWDSYLGEFNVDGSLVDGREISFERELLASRGEATEPAWQDLVLDRLLAGGICEADASRIVEHFDVSSGQAASEKSKNRVYVLEGRGAERTVVKFVGKKKEAIIEAKVNYHFSRHPVLRNYVARSDLASPLAVAFDSKTRYLTVQNYLEDRGAERLLKGSKRDAMQYLSNWMKILARLHVYGTDLMNRLDERKAALSLYREKDESRIALANKRYNLVGDFGLRSALVGIDIGRGKEFINQDLRFANRVGYKAIDWGHAGFGNGLLDVARVVSDSEIQRVAVLSEGDYRSLIGRYLQEKENCVRALGRAAVGESSFGNFGFLGRENSEDAFLTFQGLRLLYFQAESGYHSSCSDLRSASEARTFTFQSSKIPELERYLRPRMGRVEKLFTV